MGSKTQAARRTLFGLVPVATVAKRSGLHLSYLYLVIAGQRRLSFDAADKVARALKISLDDLRKRERRLAKLVAVSARDLSERIARSHRSARPLRSSRLR